MNQIIKDIANNYIVKIDAETQRQATEWIKMLDARDAENKRKGVE